MHNDFSVNVAGNTDRLDGCIHALWQCATSSSYKFLHGSSQRCKLALVDPQRDGQSVDAALDHAQAGLLGADLHQFFAQARQAYFKGGLGVGL